MGMRVSNLMTRDVFALEPEADLEEARELMDERRVRHVPVIDRDGDLVGLLTHRDLLRTSLLNHDDVPRFVVRGALRRVKIAEVMTSEVEVIEPDADIREAAQIMFDNKYGCLPVVEGSRVVGILTESDFVRLLAEGD